MTCTCSCQSPFRWAEFPRASRFLSDVTFTAGAASGTTASQKATAAADRFEAANGRSLGTVYDISPKANAMAAQLQDQRRARRAGHYSKGAA